MGSESYGLHWFRRDLRVAGNPALQWSWKEHGGRVLGFFCFDPVFLSRPDFSPNRFAFFLATLRELARELRELGGDLLVIDEGPDRAFGRIFELLRQRGEPLPSSISFNRDYEPFARDRDSRMSEVFESLGITAHTERDHLLIEPHEIVKEHDGGTYQIFTPFSKRWFNQLRSAAVVDRINSQKRGIAYLSADQPAKELKPPFSLRWEQVLPSPPPNMLSQYEQINTPRVSVPIPAAGSKVALRALRSFAAENVDAYAEKRDFPSADGTSRLSIYLKNGSLTTAQILAELGGDFAPGGTGGTAAFIRQLAWREFYYYILFHHPRVEHEAFLSKFQKLDWENRDDYFSAWKEGRTGYPIIDAGMRQLNSTGWMHNRVRMIVASFLTKDLLVSWQWGERYFMQQLLDGDLAPNNGGWQWAASTGCDPQPHFRIFNPLLQSRKFDASGDYLRRYLPELRFLDDRSIHAPHEYGARVDYPEPIVDHQEQKERALEMFDAVNGQ